MRLSLRRKWTIAILTVAIVPMVVLGLLVLDIQRRGLDRAEKELEAAVVDEAATSVIVAIDEAADVAARSAMIFANESIDVDARTQLITDLAGHTPGALGLAFFDAQNHFVDAVIPTGPKHDAVLASLRDPPLPTQGFRVITSSASSSSSSSTREITLRYEGLLQAGKGSIVVAISRSALDARLRELSQNRFGAPDRVYLVDESLDILAGHPSNPSLPIFAAAGFPKATFTTAAPLVVTTEFRDDGVDKVGTIRTMPMQRWALIVERPTDEAFGALATARRAFLVLLALFASIAAITGAIVVRRVVGPINVLMALVQRYARRDFAARSDVKSGDELEALGSSLETMADDLTKSDLEIKKRARIEANLRRYMPAEAADAAALSEDALHLGGAKRRVTVVFADVVAFTGFAETASPEKAVAFLNELFTILSEIVFRHGGMVDKFIGDCVMAVFRPSEQTSGGEVVVAQDDVARALLAAEDMHAFVASSLPRWREVYSFSVELGIGVSTGDVLIGNLGSTTRLEYTVIGDAVNVAARLESLAGPRQTLATQAVVDACPDMTFTSLGSHALRGKAKPVEVYEVVT